VREDVVRTNLLDEIRRRLTSKEHIAYARKKATELLASMSRTQGTRTKDLRARLTKLETQIARLVEFITDGERSPAIDAKLKALESEAKGVRRELKSVQRETASPIVLPTPKQMTALIFDLERRLMADVSRGREELRRLFRDGKIKLDPQPGRYYVARSEILPLVLMTRWSS
jgi:chromosome segregation ATPase